MEYVINLTWDNDADVWIATSDDIPGLVLESGSFAVPELIALNSPGKSPCTLSFVSNRHERIAL